jgi:DNA invertase Pin-like site-specific DNA recombinase
MRVAIYARVSTTDQQTKMQTTDLEAFCKAREFQLVDSYVDEGVSGSKDSRPQLDRLMNDARKRRFDAVLVWKLDRWGRSLKHLVTSIAELEGLGVAFISYKENLDLSTPSGRLMFNVIAAMAEFERDMIRERTIAGVRHARSKGKVLGRPTTVTTKRADIVRLRGQGRSLRAIAGEVGCSEGSIRLMLKASA